jgi:hypothetical protein
MTPAPKQPAFAAFRHRVFADKGLQEQLHQVLDRDAFIALVVRPDRKTDSASLFERDHIDLDLAA